LRRRGSDRRSRGEERWSPSASTCTSTKRRKRRGRVNCRVPLTGKSRGRSPALGCCPSPGHAGERHLPTSQTQEVGREPLPKQTGSGCPIATSPLDGRPPRPLLPRDPSPRGPGTVICFLHDPITRLVLAGQPGIHPWRGGAGTAGADATEAAGQAPEGLGATRGVGARGGGGRPQLHAHIRHTQPPGEDRQAGRPDILAEACKIAARRGKKTEVVALARRLAGVLFAMMRDGTE
jgi:hypothetical protein